MYTQDFKPLLDQIREELKEIEAARRAAGALREKMEGWEPIAGGEKARQREEAVSEWGQLEASLQGLHDSTLALGRSVREGSSYLRASAAPEQPEAQEPETGKGEQAEKAHVHIHMIEDNQARLLSAIDGLKRHISDTASLQDRWMLMLAAGLILNLALCLGFLFQGMSGTVPTRESSFSPAVTEAGERKQEETEMEAAPTLTKEKEVPAEPSFPPALLPSETAEALIGHRAGYAMVYLKKKAFGRLAARYFHPEKGIHFLPFGLKAAGHRFPAEAVKAPFSDAAVFHWGMVEGAPVEMDFEQYYLRYIFDVDFTEGSEIQYNELQFSGSAGLSAGQVARRFPDCAFAEYHKAGSSLVLVFEKWSRDNNWYLSAAIHSQ